MSRRKINVVTHISFRYSISEGKHNGIKVTTFTSNVFTCTVLTLYILYSLNKSDIKLQTTTINLN